MANFIERLQSLIDTYYKSRNSEFSKATGIQESALSRWLKGGSYTISKVKLVENAGINSNWLLTGDGEMLTTQKVESNVGEVRTSKMDRVLNISKMSPDELEAYKQERLKEIELIDKLLEYHK